VPQHVRVHPDRQPRGLAGTLQQPGETLHFWTQANPANLRY
jgi:hypothetical protein